MKKMSTVPPKTANDRFTDDQWQAIYQTGDNLLIAASAGSGKTTVLVQRIIEKIKNGVNVDELLVVTFTESAASEMKDRIRVAIQEAVNKAVSDEQYHHLLRQMILLPQANISTIHAFCLKVIQRFFYLIDIDPVFRMMGDAIEIEMLKEDVWEELKEELYGESDSFFKDLSKAYSSSRNDDGLKDLIFSLYNFSRANPNPEKWLDDLSRLYSVEEGLENSFLFRQLLKPQIKDELAGIHYHIMNGLHLANDDNELIKHQELFIAEQEAIQQIIDAIDKDDYQKSYELLDAMTFSRWPSKKKDDPAGDIKDQMKAIRDNYKKTTTDLRDTFFTRPKTSHETIIQQTKPYVEEMIRVAKRFSEAYWQRKLSGNMLDFNDLEHLTLDILLPMENGKRQPSDASRYYRQKFQEVLIDEYQDVNKLQENILHGVTRHDPETENLFMVGDVKQSIYAFRLADPGLFLEKYRHFGQSDGGERIILAENFRSRGEVISFTNFIFTQLMDEKVGQMAYDDAAQLLQGNDSFPDRDHFDTEVLIYLKEEEDEEAVEFADDSDLMIDDKATGEVTMVAQKIRDMIQNKVLIYDKKAKAERPMTYKDIVLLTPTKKNNLLIMETFKEYGISVILNDSQSFFQRTEITVILSLLKVIDNPRQDIALAAVLRSPIVGLNERQLASIRIALSSGDYYDAVNTYITDFDLEKEHDKEKRATYHTLIAFLEQLNKWRQTARQNNLVQLIWQIYEETHFLDYVGGMTSGKQRVANLHAFYERAKKYESTNFKGLFQFIRFIERIQDRDQDLAEPTIFSEDEDAVRVMTIHASKGLEFPIVFVMDMSKSFNLQDIRADYLFSEEYGIGTDLFDSVNRMKYPSLTTFALANEKKKQLLAEEMRKLYVALTRAEQKLFLVGTYKTEEKMWQEWSAVDETTNTVMPDHLRLKSSNLMRWVGYALYRHGSVDPDSLDKHYRGELTNYPVSFSISFKSEAELLTKIIPVNLEDDIDWEKRILTLTDDAQNQSETEQAAEEDYQAAIALMEAKYGHEIATRTTSYQSVSEIKRLFEDPDQAHLLQIDLSKQGQTARYVETELGRPTFMQDEIKPTNAEIGTAVHYVIQQLELDKPVTQETVQELIKELVKHGSIKENVAERITQEQIYRFFETDIGKKVQKDASLVSREVPFTMLMNAENLFEGIKENSDDHILIHGIIDGFIEYEDHLILFDFKTDYIGQNLDKVIDKYRGQMIVYREALEEIKQKKVTETYLCLLSINENVLID